ncbi:MAG: hypothetical protein EP344_07400 [Bacteroidetes bacterium]|nr:MAG: hypothetical protein EP344_07400 [Bacteroidota bacterium]
MTNSPLQKDTGSNQLAWADRLRNIATVLVIIIHVTSPVVQEYPNLDSHLWWAGNLWNTLGRPAVNLFVMLSGFLLFSKDYPLGLFLRKRFTRVLIPAAFWMVLYLIYGHIANQDPASWHQAIVKLVQGPVHYHLWFIYLIIGLYLMYPVLQPWVRKAREQDFLYFFIVCIIGTWGYKTLLAFSGVRIGLHFEIFTNQIGHFVLGYYLGSKAASSETPSRPGLAPWPLHQRQMLTLARMLIIGGAAITAAGGYWHSTRTGNFQPYFYDYLTPAVTLGAAGWMLLARHGWNQRPLLKVEQLFAAGSFGIYLVHVLVLDGLTESSRWLGLNPRGIWTIPLTAALAVLLSFTAVLLIRALPFGKKIT